jgi:hypothetical protein
MSETTPAGRGRLPLGKALGQAWALYLAGFVALAGGIALVLNPGPSCGWSAGCWACS